MKRKLFSIVMIFAASLSLACGDGAIQFVNGALTRVRWVMNAGSPPVNLPTGLSMVYGVFVVSSNSETTLVLPLATSSTTAAGIIVAPNPYFIPGTTNGQTVSLQIKGWSASFGTDWQAAWRTPGANIGETDVRQVTLGDANAPTVIWQTAAGINPNRFFPLVIGYPIEPPINTPAIFINDVMVAEGNSGTVTATFTVSLSNPQGSPTNYPKTASFYTQNGSAVGGQDYVPTNGIITFSAGETSHTVSVVVIGDPTPELDEQFFVALANPVGAWIPKAQGACVITEARIIEAHVDGADIAVSFRTVAGHHYAVEFSTDCTNWAVVPGANEITGIGGPMTIHDVGAGMSQKRFYRLRLR